MANIKTILIPVVAFALILGGASFAFAKEKENKGEKRKEVRKDLLEVVLPFLSTSTSYTATSTPPEPTPTSSPTPTPTATSTATTTTPVTGSTNTTSGKSGQVNATLANGFFGSNYYGSNALGSGATRALVAAGFISAILGLALLSGKTYRISRLYS